MKLAIIDLDGVVANVDARFAHAEEVRQTYLYPDSKDAINAYWQAVFDSEYVPTDTLIDGVNEALLDVQHAGYRLIFLTSRPESMRDATARWLFEHTVYDLDDELIMKAPAFQYTKTVVWKAGIVQTLEALYGATDLLIVDDEQANIDEHLKYFNTVQTREICKSLAEAVAKLNGTWVELDPFLPPE